MKKRQISNIILTAVITLTLGVACTKMDVQTADTNTQLVKFTAFTEGDEQTKTNLGERDGDMAPILWELSDEIRIANNYYDDKKFTISNANGKSATFEGYLDNKPPFVAFYPDNGFRYCSVYSKTVDFRTFGTQTYRTNSISQNSMPMFATSENLNLAFKNLFGILRLQLKGNTKISQIKVSSESNLWGDAKLSFADLEKLNITFDADDIDIKFKTITLECGEDPIVLSDSKITTFDIVLPPTNGSSELQIEIINEYGVKIKKTIPNSTKNAIKRSTVTLMPELEVNTTEDPNFFNYIVNGKNYGKATYLAGAIWAPVNCGYNPESNKLGLLYQWGRKDGFGLENEEPTFEQVDALAYADIKNPDPSKLYNDASKDYKASYAGQWVMPNGTTPAFTMELDWNTLPENIYGTKIANPCPDGWRVPTTQEIENLAALPFYKIETGLWIGKEAESATFSDPKGCVYFPFAGNIATYGFHSGDGGAFYWAANPFENYSKVIKGSILKMASYDSEPRAYYEDMALAASVRCVKAL